jgi:hypothetical protein
MSCTPKKNDDRKKGNKAMEISIIKVVDRDDGSADVEIRMDEVTKLWLINYAFNDILSKGLTDIEALHKQGVEVKLEGERDDE